MRCLFPCPHSATGTLLSLSREMFLLSHLFISSLSASVQAPAAVSDFQLSKRLPNRVLFWNTPTRPHTHTSPPVFMAARGSLLDADPTVSSPGVKPPKTFCLLLTDWALLMLPILASPSYFLCNPQSFHSISTVTQESCRCLCLKPSLSYRTAHCPRPLYLSFPL